MQENQTSDQIIFIFNKFSRLPMGFSLKFYLTHDIRFSHCGGLFSVCYSVFDEVPRTPQHLHKHTYTQLKTEYMT